MASLRWQTGILKFLSFPLYPFGRYRHGCDPPVQESKLSFLAASFDNPHVVLNSLSVFRIFFSPSQSFFSFEPFGGPFDRLPYNQYLLCLYKIR